MKTILSITMAMLISTFGRAEAIEPFSADMKEVTVYHAVSSIASLHNLDVVLPESTMSKKVTILVKSKRPMEVLEAIAVASGHVIKEVGGIYVFSEDPGEVISGCSCLLEAENG